MRTEAASRTPRRRLLPAAALVAAGLVTLTPPAPAQAWQDVESFSWDIDQNPSGDLEGYGAPGRFRFYDGDLDPALSGLSVVASSTSDPTGIRVLTERALRADSTYWGSVVFTGGPSDQDAGRLQVRDGDTVTVTYTEPRDRFGRSQVRTATETWWARTRPVDWREVGMVDPADGPAHVRGVQRSAPAGSTVRVFEPSAAEPVLVGTADDAGRFLLAADGDLPPSVELTAQEPGLAESPRVPLDRAWLAGRVVVPGAAGQGVRSGIVVLQDPDGQGCPEHCPWTGAFSDRDGYFHVPTPDRRTASGDYALSVDFQGFVDAERSEWFSTAYGDPRPVVVSVPEGGSTAVVDDLLLRAPVFVGDVRTSDGTPVTEAQIDVLDPAGSLQTNSYTRDDGRFALHLEDGDHRLHVEGPVGCMKYTDAWIDVSVRDGVASPSTATATIDPDGHHGEVWTIPLDPPEVGVTVRLDGPGVELTLRQPEGAGTVSIRCTSADWDDMEVLDPPLDLHWDAGFDEATVCLDYDPASVAAAGVEEGDLELLHREHDGTLSSIATRHDPVEDTVCGETTSFSPFALGVPGEPGPGPQPQPQPAPTASPEPEPEPSAPTGPQARATDDACPAGRVPEDGFTDVPVSNPHEPSIDCVLWWALAKGKAAGRYAPADPVDRAQMATFLVNLLDRTGAALPPASGDRFADDTGSVHEDSINRLAEAGIVLGRADGGYGPGLPVTRDAMATFLVRTHERRSGQPLTATRSWFADDDGNTHESSIDRAAEAGLTGGAAGGGYAPGQPVRRDQMASFLARLLDLLVEQRHAVPPTT